MAQIDPSMTTSELSPTAPFTCDLAGEDAQTASADAEMRRRDNRTWMGSDRLSRTRRAGFTGGSLREDRHNSGVCGRFPCVSDHDLAACYRNDSAGHVAAKIRCRQHVGAGEIGRLPGAAQKRLLSETLSLIRGHCAYQAASWRELKRGPDRAWCDRVDAYALIRQHFGQAGREIRDRPLRCGMGQKLR